MSSASRLPRQQEKESFILSRLELLADFHLWPIGDLLDPLGWLSNFESRERPYALNILYVHLHFSDRLINALFQAAVHSLSAELTANAQTPDHASAIWQSFLASLTVTYVEGESRGPSASGYRFTSKARQVAGIPEPRIVHPPAALRTLLINSNSPLLFVDDFIGSGQQMKADWSRKHRVDSIDISFSDVCRPGASIFYVPLIATTHGLNNVRRSCPGLIVRPAHVLDSTYSLTSADSILWPQHLKQSANDVLFAASRRAGIVRHHKQGWQGFHDLALPLSFDHSVPDATLPLIYWETDNWKPLIRMR